MDALYSFSLLLSLAASGAAVVWGIVRLVGRRGSPRGAGEETRQVRSASARSRALAWGLVTCAAAAVTVSVLVHARWGHGPASAEPMGSAELVQAHPAFLCAGAMVVLAAALTQLGSKR
ncbi:MAG TPA: hypothetical protein VNB06_14795 [Thermoanaerobaculia bacterium]|nr:hypothetical protein [Thermoanaerobaculia bacterium]